MPHGFRSSFRDRAAEETNHPREVVEAALATGQGHGGGAHAKVALFERRRRLNDWSSYLGQTREQSASAARRRRVSGWTRHAQEILRWIDQPEPLCTNSCKRPAAPGPLSISIYIYLYLSLTPLLASSRAGGAC